MRTGIPANKATSAGQNVLFPGEDMGKQEDWCSVLRPSRIRVRGGLGACREVGAAQGRAGPYWQSRFGIQWQFVSLDGWGWDTPGCRLGVPAEPGLLTCWTMLPVL